MVITVIVVVLSQPAVHVRGEEVEVVGEYVRATTRGGANQEKRRQGRRGQRHTATRLPPHPTWTQAFDAQTR